mmetsp:Transcript_45694/g.138851  ORF Transcript_45694/g.138851 Transcript_45694/m.138851 type:complete len:85 (-) Transcript_45694:580-834(-)
MPRQFYRAESKSRASQHKSVKRGKCENNESITKSLKLTCPSITGNESVLPILCPSTPFYMAQTVNSPVSRASILMVAAVPIGEF